MSHNVCVFIIIIEECAYPKLAGERTHCKNIYVARDEWLTEMGTDNMLLCIISVIGVHIVHV